MKKGTIVAIVLSIVVVAVVVFAVFYDADETKDWQVYENSRYGFQVSYPAGWTLGEAPTNNDGRELISPDGDATCHAYGFYNSLIT